MLDASSERPSVNVKALWERLDAHGCSQNKVVRRSGINPAHLSQIVSSKRNLAQDVLRESNGQTARVGGRVPHSGKVDFAYRAGYDGTGHVYVTHVIERGCSPLLKQREPATA